MTDADFYIREGTTAPPFAATLTDDHGDPIALTNATVAFRMRALNASTYKVNRAAVIDDAAGGRVRYEWQAADTDTAGRYLAEWLVTFASQETEAFPNDRTMIVVITDSLIP